jgi:hypothetical protein
MACCSEMFAHGAKYVTISVNVAQNQPLTLRSLSNEWAKREKKTYLYLFKLQEQHAALQERCSMLVSGQIQRYCDDCI